MGKTTKEDRDWVPFEIAYAIDSCDLPVIAAYPGYVRILQPGALRPLWPAALASRIDSHKAKVIHVPFKQKPLSAAIQNYDIRTKPKGPLTYYTADAYRRWGI